MDWEFDLVAGPYDVPTDGPVWDGQALLFTQLAVPANTINNRILRYDPASGQVSDYRKWTNRVASLAFSPEGILYGCQSGARRLVRFNADGSATPLGYRVDGKYINQPKDLVVDRRGRIWFGDPVWGPPVVGGLRNHELEPYSIKYRAVLRMDTPNQHAPLTRLTYDTDAPLAVLLSRDEQTLYVAESGEGPEARRELRAYPVDESGNLGPYRLLHTFGSDYRGAHRGISGMCLDREGNIVAGAGGEGVGPGPMLYVFAPSGQILETQPVPAEPTNCAFGGPALDQLYVTTTGGHLYRVANSGRQGWALYPGTE